MIKGNEEGEEEMNEMYLVLFKDVESMSSILFLRRLLEVNSFGEDGLFVFRKNNGVM